MKNKGASSSTMVRKMAAKKSIRKKLPRRNDRLGVTYISRSAPFVAEKISGVAGGTFKKWSTVLADCRKKNLRARSNLFIVGLYCKGPFKQVFNDYRLLANSFNRLIIVFSGTDLLQLRSFSSGQRMRLFKMLKLGGAKFFGVGKYAQEEAIQTIPEIAALSMDVGVLYFPMQHALPAKLPKKPARFNVGCYMPPSAADFYGFDVIKPASLLLPDVNFHLYSLQGAGKKQYGLPKDGYKNIICHPLKIESKDMSKFIGDMSCGLRLTKHDGNPMSLAEYNALGRWFVYNKDMPYCDTLRDRDPKKLAIILNDIKSRKPLNTGGVSFYRNRHSLKVFLNNIQLIYKGR